MEVHPFLKKLFVFLRSTVSCDINFLSFFILVTLHQVLFFFINLSLFYFYYSETIFFLLGTNLCYFFPRIQLISFPFQVLYMCVCVNYFVSFQMTPMLVKLGRCHIFLVALLVCISDCLLLICVKNIKSMGRWYLNDS